MFSVKRNGFFKTSASPEEVAAVIGNADIDLCDFKYRTRILMISISSVLELTGTQKLGISYNSFIPEIKMTSVKDNDMTRIDVELKLPAFMTGFTVFLFVFYTILQVLTVIFSSYLVPIALLLPVILALFTFLVICLGFKLTSNRVLKDLEYVLSKYLSV